MRAARREAELNDLAEQAANGNKEALNRLLEVIRTPVVRYCRGKMGEGIGLITPEDVAQDVLFAVCGALHRFRPGETAAMAFVYGIARNKVVDAFRSHGRDRSDPTEVVPDAVDDQRGPEAAAVLGTEISEMKDLLALLPPTQQEVLVLRIAMQFSAEETARAIGSTPGAVRVTQHRAMNRLRALLSERVELHPVHRGGGVLVQVATVQERHAQYVEALAVDLDLDAGLAEIEHRRLHRTYVAALGSHLDLDAGLAALVRRRRNTDPDDADPDDDGRWMRQARRP